MSTAEGLASSTLDPEEVAYAGVVGQRALLDAGRLTAVERCLRASTGSTAV